MFFNRKLFNRVVRVNLDHLELMRYLKTLQIPLVKKFNWSGQETHPERIHSAASSFLNQNLFNCVVGVKLDHLELI